MLIFQDQKNQRGPTNGTKPYTKVPQTGKNHWMCEPVGQLTKKYRALFYIKIMWFFGIYIETQDCTGLAALFVNIC